MLNTDLLYGFMGINMLMGYNRMLRVEHYWDTGDDLGVPIVKETMTRDTFKHIRRNLHLNNNLEKPQDCKDKLFKLQPFLEMAQKSWRTHRDPPKFQIVDDVKIRFKGRSTLKQFNPAKPIKRGYLLWCRAGKDGYIYIPFSN